MPVIRALPIPGQPFFLRGIYEVNLGIMVNLTNLTNDCVTFM